MRIRRAEFLWLALICVLLVMAVWWFPGSGTVNSDSYSVSHSGKKALYQTLRRLEPDVSRSLENLIPRPGFRDRLLILGPARSPSADEWNELYFAVRRGATLVFAASARNPYVDADVFDARVVSFGHDSSAGTDGEAMFSEVQAEPAESENVDSAPDGDYSDSGSNANESTTVATDETNPDVLEMLFFEDESVAETDLVEGEVDWKTKAWIDVDTFAWEVLVAAESKPQVVRRRIGAGTVVLAASDEIFSNKALTEPDRALLAYRIIESAAGTGHTWFDESLNSSGVPKVLGILFDPTFRPVTLQLVLIALLFGWSGSYRFGPAKPPATPRRRSIVEHAEAVGVLYFRAGAGAHAAKCQLEFLKQELRRLYGTTLRAENAGALLRQAGLDEGELKEPLAQANVTPGARLSSPAAGRLLRGLVELLARIRDDSTRRPS